MRLSSVIILVTYWIMTSYAFIPQYNYQNLLFQTNYLYSVSHEKNRNHEMPTFGNNEEESNGLNQDNQNQKQQQQQQQQERYLWNMTALQMDLDRLIYRSNQKLIKLQSKVVSSTPIKHELEIEQQQQQQRYNQLLQLKSSLQSYSTTTMTTITNTSTTTILLLPMDIIRQIQELNVTDQPRRILPRGPGKVKGPRYSSSSSRLPYRRYYSLDGIEIRVGRRAQDNDLLSCSPQYRDDTDAWLHVAHSPGSHVIIRCSGRPISSLPETTIYDAAALAVRYSKSWKEEEQDDDMSFFWTQDNNKIPVHLTTCQNIQKPFGAKPGLVQIITGPYQTIVISPPECLDRLKRLETTLDNSSSFPLT